MNTVLFACIHNAGRSQMAAAYFNRFSDARVARAVSAGTKPAASVHPVVIDAMREEAIELGGVEPRLLTAELAATASLLVTMGCGETCPHVPGLSKEDWKIDDPKEASLAGVRVIRDEVRARVLDLLRRRGWAELPRDHA